MSSLCCYALWEVYPHHAFHPELLEFRIGVFGERLFTEKWSFPKLTNVRLLSDFFFKKNVEV